MYRYLLAWSSTIKPKPLAETEVKIDKLLSSVSFSTFIQYWMINRMKVISHTAYSKFRSWIFGEKVVFISYVSVFIIS